MNININAKKFKLTEALKQYAIKRINFSLGHKSEHIQKIAMRLSDINGPRGGADKRCQLQIKLNGMANVVVADTQSDMYNAIDSACDRASYTVTKKIGRKHTIQRRLKQIIPFAANEEVLA